MSVIQAVLQGLIQGLTEFLPVSSSGHLVLGSALLGLPAPGLSFSIILHLGTGFAVLVMLRNEILWLVKAAVRPDDPSERLRALKLAGFVALASLPAAVVGILGGDLIDRSFSSGGVAATGLILTGFFLRFSSRPENSAVEAKVDGLTGQGTGQEYPRYRQEHDRERSGRSRRVRRRVNSVPDRGISSVTLGKALLVGLSQAVAIVPGISRSGITITSGLLSGVSREDAARFSFLLSIPAVFGAALLDFRAASAAATSIFTWPALLGAGVSFVAGMFALSTVFAVVRKGNLSMFSYYCWIVGFGSLLWLMFS